MHLFSVTKPTCHGKPAGAAFTAAAGIIPTVIAGNTHPERAQTARAEVACNLAPGASQVPKERK